MRYATFACVVESHLIYPTQLLSHNVLLLGLAMSKALILILFVVRRAIFRYPFHAGAMRVKWRTERSEAEKTTVDDGSTSFSINGPRDRPRSDQQTRKLCIPHTKTAFHEQNYLP